MFKYPVACCQRFPTYIHRHMVVLVGFWGISLLISVVASLQSFLTIITYGFHSPYILSAIICFLLMTAPLTGMRWNFKAICIDIHLMVKNVEYFPNTHWPFVFLLLITVCWIHLLIYCCVDLEALFGAQFCSSLSVPHQFIYIIFYQIYN